MWTLLTVVAALGLAARIIFHLGEVSGWRRAQRDMQAVLATKPDWTALTEDEQRVMLGIVERQMREQRARWDPFVPAAKAP